MVILHAFIGKKSQKQIAKQLPFCPLYGKLPYFYLNRHILLFQKNQK